MDPRSQATVAVLEQQQSLGLEIFAELRRSRQAMTELKAVASSLAKLNEQLKGQPRLLTEAEKLEAAIGAIEKGSKTNPEAMGLEAASGGLQSVLRMVESGDRTTPQQAIEVYRLSDEAAKARIAEWNKLKSGELAEFNRSVRKLGLQPLEISALEDAIDFLLSR
jgi:hypothetical protein